MTKIKLRYVQEYESGGRVYRYFRRAGVRIPLPGLPGSAEFQTAYAAALAGSEPAPKPRYGEKTVAHAAELLRASMQWKTLAPTTRRVMDLTLAAITTDHGARSMLTLTRPDLIRLRDSMADRPGAARNWLALFAKLCRVAIDHGWRLDDPSETVRVEYRQEPFTPWTWADVQTFIDHHKTGRPILALMLLLCTGQRRGDVVRMGWPMVDRDVIRMTQGKTGKSLLIPIRPELRAQIERCPREHATFLGDARGKPTTAASFGNWFRERCDEAGLRNLSAHGLRKLALTGAAEHGATAHQIQALGGHTTLAMVAHYTQSADQARLAREAIDYPLPIRLGPV